MIIARTASTNSVDNFTSDDNTLLYHACYWNNWKKEANFTSSGWMASSDGRGCTLTDLPF